MMHDESDDWTFQDSIAAAVIGIVALAVSCAAVIALGFIWRAVFG